MKHYVKWCLWLLALAGTGCAYYNTLFNAKRLYRQAEKIRRESDAAVLPAPADELYGRVIKKTAKVLKFYPQHSCVDEALLVMGMAFYRRGEHEKALRKFQELTVQYPKSEFLAEGLLGMGLIYYATNNPVKAEEVFRKILKSDDIVNIRRVQDNALFMLAQMAAGSNDQTQAIAGYRNVLATYTRSEQRQQAQYNIAECFYQRGDYQQAYREYQKVLAFKGTRILRYKSNYNMGQCLIRQQQYAPALALYQQLIKDDKNEKHFPAILLQVAACHELRQDYPAAIAVYSSIIADYGGTPEVPVAHLKLGALYKDRLEDYTKAEENYTQALNTATDDSVRQKAQQEKKNLEEFNFCLREVFKEKKDSTGLAHRLQLAELYFLKFGKPDSALAQYRVILEEYGNSRYAPKAAYASGWIYENLKQDQDQARRYYNQVLQDYPESPYADSLRVKLKVASGGKTREAEAREGFRAAEERLVPLLEAEQPVSSEVVEGYLQVAQDYTGTETAAQAEYVAAWLFDYVLYDSAQAHSSYQRVVDGYPETEYARKARLKLAALVPAAADTAQPLGENELQKVKRELQRKDRMYDEMMHDTPPADVPPEVAPPPDEYQEERQY